MFISTAHAQATGGGVGGFDLITILPLVLIFVVFYFLLIRPQQRKVKEHKAMIGAVRRGDRVVTAGGIVGLVTKVLEGEDEVQVEIADGVRVRVVRSTISQVLAKPGAAGETAKPRAVEKEANDNSGNGKSG